MIQTVRKNFDNFTGEDIDKEKLYHKMQLKVPNLPDGRFKAILSGSSINHCQVEVKDVSNSCAIFGANRNRLRGVNTRPN